MKKQTSNRSGLLLMEIIIAILFFSVISAICLQLFVKSHIISRDTKELDSAVNKASSAAEIIRGTQDAKSALQNEYPHMKTEEDKIYIYYDKEFKPCSETDAGYCLEIGREPSEGRLTAYNIAVAKSGSSSHIYELKVVAYKPAKP